MKWMMSSVAMLMARRNFRIRSPAPGDLFRVGAFSLGRE